MNVINLVTGLPSFPEYCLIKHKFKRAKQFWNILLIFTVC